MNETHPILEELEQKADYIKANLDSLAAVDTTELTSIWKYLQASEALMVDVFDAENAGKIPDVGGRQGEHYQDGQSKCCQRITAKFQVSNKCFHCSAPVWLYAAN